MKWSQVFFQPGGRMRVCPLSTAAIALSASGRACTKYCRLSMGSIASPERWLIDTLCLIASVPRKSPSCSRAALTFSRAS